MERPSPFEIVGTLPDWAIKAHIRNEVIKINPLQENWEQLVDQTTIDLNMGSHVKRFRRGEHRTIDLKFTPREEIEDMMEDEEYKPGQAILLTKDDFITVTTAERLTLPPNIQGHLYGKSSLARVGVVVHVSAERFDPGWDGNPTLELGSFLDDTDFIFYPDIKICAFSFEKLAWDVDVPYMGKPNRSFGGTDKPEASNISRSGLVVLP